ncbi:MAG TPA: sigma-E factor regulatory protein RseB domain-containing protein [Streptosporangiaceae bacterium]|nr:sigma-E factor regulatory protein RseB domain-containing protein [Streptosporangiaceae bacterium]
MFSRATPLRDGEAPDHDPLHLRIATAVVVLGLIATGAAVVWWDGAGRGGALAHGTATGGALREQALVPPQRTAPRQSAASSSGLRLLSEAATACRSVSYQGVQLTAWQGPDGSWTSLVNVWHQRDHQTLIQAETLPAGPAGPAASKPPLAADPDGDGDDDASQRDPEGIMGMTPQMVALLGANYQVLVAGLGRVAGRPAQEVVLRRSDGKLAARFWLDSVTKLPLRRETFDARARVVSEDAFISLKIGAPAAARAPAAGTMPWSRPLASAQLARLRAAGWPLPGHLPGNLTLVQASETGGAPGTVVDLAYSDGLSVISLFLERGYLPAQLNGWSPVAFRGERVYAADPDQRSVAWSARGFVYTLIADAPDQTVDQVVTDLPHNADPGFFTRMGRGLRRLASWLNPFR